MLLYMSRILGSLSISCSIKIVYQKKKKTFNLDLYSEMLINANAFKEMKSNNRVEIYGSTLWAFQQIELYDFKIQKSMSYMLNFPFQRNKFMYFKYDYFYN